MLKRILAVSLALNFSPAAQAASPITLLSEQCIDYQVSLSQAQESPTQLDASVRLERELIGLFNLKDSVRFYRHYPLNAEDKEALLQCQLHLADEFDRLAHEPWLQTQSQNWSQSDAPGLRQFGQLLTQQIAEQIDQQQKAKIHTAQASVAHGLKQKDLSLSIGQSQCRLTDEETQHADRPEQAFDNSIASYLIHQKDESCKRQVWQAYQVRAKQKNQAAISLIMATKQTIALEHGADDYASWALSHQRLANPAQVKHFLDSQTQLAPAPWTLGSKLAVLSKVEVTPRSGEQLLDDIQAELSPFGLEFETVNTNMLRLWHKGRLLGDVFLDRPPKPQLTGSQRANPPLGKQKHPPTEKAQTPTIKTPTFKEPKAQLSPLRQTVVGQQFGQLTLTLPDQLNDYRSQEQLIAAVAEMMSRLLTGGRYYLNNTLGDGQAIASLWLNQYLSQQLLPELPSNSREAELKAFSKQLKVFRSKLALSAYQTSDNRLYRNLSQEFGASFGAPWPGADDALYSFTGVVTQGPLYYLTLWHQRLAEQILSDAQLEATSVFELLLINEQQQPLDEQLTAIFGSAQSVATILERSQHDQPKPVL
ncbi:hypothetical protein K0J45_10680 [Shewanella alkalitolerans]|uniref:hypothetical protein n=1 Tax=Shewanella alkalitolerans TaxID=2864209 RepID=UPI001C659859|nr:hypothetical protein [Shewanella alkalitolerans]QYJ96038.1 hypothetical protein K0J45_10680 [Shewanella alkalitolerans]